MTKIQLNDCLSFGFLGYGEASSAGILHNIIVLGCTDKLYQSLVDLILLLKLLAKNAETADAIHEETDQRNETI